MGSRSFLPCIKTRLRIHPGAAITIASMTRPSWRCPQSQTYLQPQVAQSRMVVGTAAERPVVEPLRLLNGKIVDAGMAPVHQAVIAEFPHFVPVRSPPLPGAVVRLVSKAHRDSIVIERPKFLDEPILELARPFAREKRNDLLAAVDELRPVPPAAVER